MIAGEPPERIRRIVKEAARRAFGLLQSGLGDYPGTAADLGHPVSPDAEA